MKTKNEVVDRLNVPVCICDSTLGSGEQTPGAVFSDIEKYRIAKLLDEAGVPQIEAGNPALGEAEKASVRHIARMGLSASVMSSNRADIADINASLECDVDSVSIGLPVSDIQMSNLLGKDREWVLNKIYESVFYAAEHGLYIGFVAEDASRADLGFLIDVAKVAKEAGADRFAYCDSVGVEDPFTCNERVRMLKQISGIDIEIIARNDFGMATANTLAALKAGARFARVTTMGLGLRAGNAPLEEAVLSARHLLGVDTGIDSTKLPALAASVSRASGVAIWPSKPVLGSNCFAQETGIINNPSVTEPYDPSEVGLARSIVIGKHAVRNTVVAALAEIGIEVDRNDADRLLVAVRSASAQMHRSLTPDELFLLYSDMVSGDNTYCDEPAGPTGPAGPAE
ncbi:MAG: homoaconitate hydratase [Thermoplasmata archaeon]|nr:homoaconitate hydratase [Thermoplasmata archaeon]